MAGSSPAGDGNFSGIGFDPAYGSVATVRSFAEQFSATATYAKDAYDALTSISRGKSDVWSGNAADAFAGKVDELPKYLGEAHQSLRIAGRAFQVWAERLREHQAEAVRIEREIQELLRESRDADSFEARARANWLSHPDDPNARATLESAVSSAEAIRERIEDLRKKARDDLRERWLDNARICADALRRAGAIAPDVGRFERLGDTFKSVIGKVGDIAGIVAAIAGVLAFIPVLTPIMGPIALIAGGIALTANATDMAVNGKWDDPGAWTGLAGDALGMIPGVRAARAGLDAAGNAVKVTDKAVDGARAIGNSMVTPGERLTKVASYLPSNRNVSAAPAMYDSAVESGARASVQKFSVVTGATVGVPASVAQTSDDGAVSATAGAGGAILGVLGALK